jgi:iron complex outermembrane receptor protein
MPVMNMWWAVSCTSLCLALVIGLAPATVTRAQDDSTVQSLENSSGDSAPASGLNLDMKLDELVKQDVVIPGFSQEVSTVERQKSTVGRSPAAVFVITPEMIKRSGARNIPEALRMAPGIDVARVNAHTWAISARGFNGVFADKLLVQIDRRIVYSATFGSVYWDMQDVVLPDVERIEVIRGPGTVMWGSNAVNGVINILTKKSNDTQGALIQSGGGDQERDFNTVRYGGAIGEDFTWRVFGQEFNRNRGWSETPSNDSWRMQHGGFRMDYTPTDEDTLTLQGDVFDGRGGERFLNMAIPTAPFATDVNSQDHFPGGNVLLRYSRVLDEETSWQLLSYYDRYENNDVRFKETRDTYYVDLQYQFSPAQYHQFITGANYRLSRDSTRGSFAVSLDPPGFTTEWAGVFAQDTMTLVEDRWYFTLGTLLEQNTFGGFQVEPTARLLFLPSQRQSAWAAVSRAVRNPTRGDTGVVFNQNIDPGNPVFISVLGNPDYQSENVMAYELGYRAAPTDDFSWDIAGYINEYRKLQGLGPIGAPFVQPPGLLLFPATLENNLSALSYGCETTATFQLTQDWRLFASYSLFEVHARGSGSFASRIEDESPHNQVYLRSSWDLSENVQFDLIGRYVDSLTVLNVPKYIEMDMRIGWQATETLEFSFVGQNLLDGHHPEFADTFSGIAATEVRRGWYAMVSWEY